MGVSGLGKFPVVRSLAGACCVKVSQIFVFDFFEYLFYYLKGLSIFFL